MDAIIVIECPEDIANELGINATETVPFTSGSEYGHNIAILEDSSLNNADFEDHSTANDSDEAYEPSDEASSSTSNEKTSKEVNMSETEEPEILPEINKNSPVKRERALKGQAYPSQWQRNININKRRKGEKL